LGFLSNDLPKDFNNLENGMAFTGGDVKDRIRASILYQLKNP
jgi:hypothetical protein